MSDLADVGTIDAEVVEDLTETEAEAVTSRIRSFVRSFPAEDVKRAYLGRVWVAMGYDSWSEWCDCELEGFRLPAVERREVVADLADSGMSNRSIADVTGADRKTVRRDIAEQVGGKGTT